jgi:hypothetical protein
MNRDDIIRIAREAGDVETDSRNRETFNFDCYGLEHFANLVAAAAKAEEREACANLVQDLCDHRVPASVYANTIRARGEA